MPGSRRRQVAGFALSGAWLLAGCGVEMAGLGGAPVTRSDASTAPVDQDEPSDPMSEEPVSDAGLVPSGSDAAIGCETEGTFALRIDAQVNWAGTTLFGIVPIVVPGNGPLDITTLVDIKKGPNGLVATLRACGANVPDFSSSVGERYGVVIPDANWEKLGERWTTLVRPKCAEPGCKYTSDLLTAQIGMEIPAQAKWPSPRDPLDPTTYRDADGDGIPGFLLLARGEQDGPMYRHPPTSTLLLERIRELMLAIRVAAELDGSIETCDRYGGPLKNLTIDTRALNCRLDSGSLCKPDQLDFLDDNLPVWSVVSARWRSLRMPVNASCADARAAFPAR